MKEDNYIGSDLGLSVWKDENITHSSKYANCVVFQDHKTGFKLRCNCYIVCHKLSKTKGEWKNFHQDLFCELFGFCRV